MEENCEDDETSKLIGGIRQVNETNQQLPTDLKEKDVLTSSKSLPKENRELKKGISGDDIQLLNYEENENSGLQSMEIELTNNADTNERQSQKINEENAQMDHSINSDNNSAKAVAKALRNPRKTGKSKKSKKGKTEKPVHICDYCQKEFLYSSHLKIHLTVHTGQKDFHCNLCDYSCAEKGSLNEHIRRHLNERPFKCPEINCGAAFTSSSDLKKHQLIHYKNDQSSKKFSCTLCPYKTGRKDHLTKHMKNIHSELRPFKCPQENCEYSAKLKTTLNDHLKTHSQEKNHVCSHPDCGFKTKWSNDLKLHMKIHSNEEKRHKCHFCEYSCHHHGNLVIHIRQHTGEKPFSCQLCPYQSTTKGSLDLHMHTHKLLNYEKNRNSDSESMAMDLTNSENNENQIQKINEESSQVEEFASSDNNSAESVALRNPLETGNGKKEKPVHICDYCQKEFSRSSALKVHLTVHTGQKDYHCNLCDYSCAQKGNLNEHVRRHLNERPFKCQEINCEAAFTTSTELKSHQLVHNKNDQSSKKFSCSLCPYKTHREDCLTEHMKSIHSELRPFKCPHENCEYLAKLKSSLNKHLKIHSLEKNHVCPHPNCGFKTKSSSRLKLHMKVHSNEEKMYKCHICGYSCHLESRLVVHIRQHTGEKAFLCQLCAYQSTNKADLNEHMKTHK